MPKNSVLCHGCCNYGVGIFVKQAVVADAETYYHIEVGFRGVKKLGLQNRIAGIFAYAVAFFINSESCFGDGAYFSADSVNFKSMAA